MIVSNADGSLSWCLDKERVSIRNLLGHFQLTVTPWSVFAASSKSTDVLPTSPCCSITNLEENNRVPDEQVGRAERHRDARSALFWLK